MRVTLTVCDVCGKTDRSTKAYVLTQGGRRRSVDLCELDARPLETLMGRRSKTTVTGPPAAKKAAASGRESKVVTMEEIEAQKQRPRQRTAKRA